MSTFFMPNDVFDVYLPIARVISCFYLILQIVILVDFCYGLVWSCLNSVERKTQRDTREKSFLFWFLNPSLGSRFTNRLHFMLSINNPKINKISMSTSWTRWKRRRQVFCSLSFLTNHFANSSQDERVHYCTALNSVAACVHYYTISFLQHLVIVPYLSTWNHPPPVLKTSGEGEGWWQALYLGLSFLGVAASITGCALMYSFAHTTFLLSTRQSVPLSCP